MIFYKIGERRVKNGGLRSTRYSFAADRLYERAMQQYGGSAFCAEFFRKRL